MLFPVSRSGFARARVARERLDEEPRKSAVFAAMLQPRLKCPMVNGVSVE